jgi:hypothetical protein
MNEKIEQAIEQLRIRKEIKSQLCKEDCVEEALALLEQFQSEQAAKGMEAMGFKKVESTKAEPAAVCDYCGTKLVDKCPHCGAPQCCPLCCAQDKIDRLTAENKNLKRPLEVNGFNAEGMMAVGKELFRLTVENTELKVRIEKLEKTLLAYGDHTPGCQISYSQSCGCGWSIIKQAIGKEKACPDN